jgi:hypothetical protein
MLLCVVPPSTEHGAGSGFRLQLAVALIVVDMAFEKLLGEGQDGCGLRLYAQFKRLRLVGNSEQGACACTHVTGSQPSRVDLGFRLGFRVDHSFYSS